MLIVISVLYLVRAIFLYSLLTTKNAKMGYSQNRADIRIGSFFQNSTFSPYHANFEFNSFQLDRKSAALNELSATESYMGYLMQLAQTFFHPNKTKHETIELLCWVSFTQFCSEINMHYQNGIEFRYIIICRRECT